MKRRVVALWLILGGLALVLVAFLTGIALTLVPDQGAGYLFCLVGLVAGVAALVVGFVLRQTTRRT